MSVRRAGTAHAIIHSPQQAFSQQSSGAAASRSRSHSSATNQQNVYGDVASADAEHAIAWRESPGEPLKYMYFWYVPGAGRRQRTVVFRPSIDIRFDDGWVAMYGLWKAPNELESHWHRHLMPVPAEQAQAPGDG